MLLASLNFLSQSTTTECVGFGPLEESAISANNVVHTILRRSVKFWGSLENDPHSIYFISYLLKQRQWDCRVLKDRLSRIPLRDPPMPPSNELVAFLLSFFE